MNRISIQSVSALALFVLAATACGAPPAPVSSSGVTKATVEVPTGTDGLTAEQRNVKDRLVIDNKPGSIKHLYIISAMSGQVIVYSTVRGKVTSSGKRLTPTSISGLYNNTNGNGFHVKFGNVDAMTQEVLQDDGTYGSSIEYLYWWDVRGAYHQHYVTGGQIVHVSDQPLAVKGIIINMELGSKPTE